MSRFKHVLMGSLLAVALVTVPVVPAVAQQTSVPTTTTATSTVTPDCGGCWSIP